MSDIGAVRNFLSSYQNLEAEHPVWVEFLRPTPEHYTVFLVPGKQVTYDIIGNRTVEYPFGFGCESGLPDEIAVLKQAEFYEAFSDWLDEQTMLGNLPVLDAGKTAESIEALDTATILDRAEDTGLFQILCKLTYTQKASL